MFKKRIDSSWSTLWLWVSVYAIINGLVIGFGHGEGFFLYAGMLLFSIYVLGYVLIAFNPMSSFIKPGFLFLGLVLIKLILFGTFLLLWKKFIGLSGWELGVFFGAYFTQLWVQVWAVRKKLDLTA